MFTNGPPGQFFYGDPGVSKSFTSDHWLNFSPRLGLVYNPDGARARLLFASAEEFSIDSLGTFLTYRVTGQNPPWGVTVSNTSGPYQVRKSLGQCHQAAIPFRSHSFRLTVIYFLYPPQIPFYRRNSCPPTTETWNRRHAARIRQ